MSDDRDQKIAIARAFMRKDRPLPKKGCSWAFYIFLVLLALALIVMYVVYNNKS